jgi:transposase
MISETRAPIQASAGQPIRIDCEYRRHGATNIFMMIDPHRGWRNVDVTKRRTNVDFAHQMRRLVDQRYPDADVIRVVLDNLSTHTEASLYGTFEPAEARRILRRIEFHFTPKHGSWLNMAEIEIGIMKGQCLARRIGDIPTLVDELEVWQRQRNVAGTKINWLFDVAAARSKLKRRYPVPATSSDEFDQAA